MKKMTKLLCVILALAMMLLCLSACASSEEPAETEEPAEESETPAEETEEPAAESEEPAEEPAEEATGSGELLIGGVGPLTGDYAVYGNAARNGAQIAVDEINAAGGVNGMTLVLDYQDSVGDPESAVNAYGMLIDNGMDVCLGGVLSGENTSIVAAAKDDGILILTPSASRILPRVPLPPSTLRKTACPRKSPCSTRATSTTLSASIMPLRRKLPIRASPLKKSRLSPPTPAPTSPPRSTPPRIPA